MTAQMVKTEAHLKKAHIAHSIYFPPNTGGEKQPADSPENGSVQEAEAFLQKEAYFLHIHLTLLL